MKTKMTVEQFFNLPEVQELQEIQKCNPWGSDAHRAAFDKMAALAKEHGGDIGDYR